MMAGVFSRFQEDLKQHQQSGWRIASEVEEAIGSYSDQTKTSGKTLLERQEQEREEAQNRLAPSTERPA
jgi:hypothetical protein